MQELYLSAAESDDRDMRSSPTVVITLSLALATGCMNGLPEKINLRPDAAAVEIVTDTPNLEIYEPVGECAAQVVQREVGEGFRQAFNELRNQGAAKGATFVMVEDVTSRAAWDFSGRTVVSVVGTAYRAK